MVPCRVFDTRVASPGAEAAAPSLFASETRVLPIAGRCLIPGSAVALAANVTVVNAAVGGSLAVYPGNEAVPFSTSIAFPPAAARAANSVVRLAPDGSIGVTNLTAGALDFIFDVSGWFE
jgi:hypothetical protein